MQESETLRKDGGALSNKRPPRILVVDDDSRLRDLLRQFLTNNGFHVSVAENAEQMNRLWLRERFDAVVLDVMMPGEDGISILKRIRASNDTTPILMLAGYKRIAANMKSKKRPSKLPEEWEVIPDTHEGIVTQEEFDTVQQLITSRRLPENKGGFENIFAGVIKCADCGYAMRAMSANRRKRPDIIDCVQYSCNNYGRYGNIMCTAHSIEARDLFNAVLTDINRFADMAVNDEKAVRAIEKRLTETDQSKAKALEKEQRKLNKRLAELDRLFSSLYEDKVMERITERNFEMMSGKYQKEQLEIEARLKEVTETLSDSYEKTQGVRDFLSLIRNYQGIKELDATIINALIDKILVSEREKLTDGMVRQEIKIYYKFIGFVGELHITPTKRWTALKPKNCTVCGVEYVPRSGISKYCPACAKKIQREKSNESKRRSRERNRQACIELSAKNDRLIWSNVKEESTDICVMQ